MSKWVMQAHFRHLCFNSFPMVLRIFQAIGFWSLQSLSEHSGIHRDSNSQMGAPLGVWGFIPSHFLHSRASFLAHNLASPCLGCKSKARVTTCNLPNLSSKCCETLQPNYSVTFYYHPCSLTSCLPCFVFNYKSSSSSPFHGPKSSQLVFQML